MHANLLHEIRRIESSSRILFTTYEFNRGFFERHIFPRFDGKNAPLVLLDPKSYNDAAVGSRLAENRYCLEPIHIPQGVFHSKIVLACSDDIVKLIVTSANITPQGYTANAELCTAIEIPHSEKSRYPFLAEVDDFLTRMESMISRSHRTNVRNLKEKCAFPNKYDSPGSTWFMHSLTKPILEQVRGCVDEKVKEALVISPFFSPGAELYDTFSGMFGKTTLFVEPGRNNAPVESLSKRRDFMFHSLTSKKNRTIHAKAIVIKTKEWEYCLTGSANFTEHALLRNANNGNVEVCLLRKAPKGYFDYLFDGEFSTTRIAPSQVNPITYEDFGDSMGNFRILDARLEEEGLVLELSDVPTTSMTVLIERLGKSWVIDNPTTTLVIPLSNEMRLSLIASSLVKVQYMTDGKILSSARLLHNLQLFSLPFLAAIIDENERSWLFRVLNRLAAFPSPGVVYRYLQTLEDQGFFESNPSTREELLLRLQPKLDDSMYSPHDELRALIERTISRHKKRLEKYLATKEPSQAKLAVDSFLILNQLILWAVFRAILDVEALRDVRTNYDILSAQFVSHAQEHSVDALQALLPHLAITAYLVDYLQSTSQDFMKAFNPRTGRNHVKDAFDKSSLDMISRVCTKGASQLTLQSIEQALPEYYDVVAGVKTSGRDVMDCLLRLRRSLKEIGCNYEIPIAPEVT